MITDIASTWNATQFAFAIKGHPVAILEPTAFRHLTETKQNLQVIERTLATPISEILRPPLTVNRWQRIEGRWQKVEVAGPSAEQAAQSHSALLSDELDAIEKSLLTTERAARFPTYVAAAWGEQPPDLRFLCRKLPPDFRYLITPLRNRLHAYQRHVADRRETLMFTLHEILPRTIGEIFYCKRRHIRHLVKEPNPLIHRHSRDAAGTLWERLP